MDAGVNLHNMNAGLGLCIDLEFDSYLNGVARSYFPDPLRPYSEPKATPDFYDPRS